MNQLRRINQMKAVSRILTIPTRSSFRPCQIQKIGLPQALHTAANNFNTRSFPESDLHARSSGFVGLLNQTRCNSSFEEKPGFFDDIPMTEKEKEKRKTGLLWSALIGSLVGVVSLSYILYTKMVNLEAKSQDAVESSNETERLEDDAGEKQNKEELRKAPDDHKSLHKSKAGFRERKIIEYENRIRSYSTPDKVFRYFATLQDNDNGTIYMTPEDFVRSLCPDTMQPEKLGLDAFIKFDKRSKRFKRFNDEIFGEHCVFNYLGEGGLISFTDYVFLLTVLGTSTRHIDIAFRMFDLNGDGEVSSEEFKRVKTIFLNMTSTGMRHRDRNTTGNVITDESQTGIMAFFFGEDGKGKLTVDKFVDFKRKLQRQVMRLEFESYKPVNGRITEVEFAEILMTYASLSEKQRKKKIKKVRKAYKDLEEKEGILFSDYLDFFSFLLNIRDVDMALSFHTVAGQAINAETFKQVAQTVAGVNLRDHLVDVVFQLFDENDDGQLSNKEFVAVMKDKLFRGLNKPKDTGLTRFLSGILTCARQHIPDYWTEQAK